MRVMAELHAVLVPRFLNLFMFNHLKVMVDTHFNLRPTGQKYWENRQRVMFAIHRAAQRHGVRFVTTRWPAWGPSQDYPCDGGVLSLEGNKKPTNSTGPAKPPGGSLLPGL